MVGKGPAGDSALCRIGECKETYVVLCLWPVFSLWDLAGLGGNIFSLFFQTPALFSYRKRIDRAL